MVTTTTNNNNHSNNYDFDIDQDDGMQDLGLPVSVQTFLWRQIAPFIRPRLGKLHEASCMFCQHAPGHHESKEACKSFEKVLVQNIQFGLSPPLTKALGAIPRWRLLQAALPHVMHCVAALLHNRVKDMQAIGAVETKLLYTMQWILLYAAEECADDEDAEEHLGDKDKDSKDKSIDQYLFSVPTITLFVYLFAPIIHHLKESDFQNFRLENGIKLWQGMWDNRAPGAPCFTAPVKPKARNLLCAPSPKGSTDIITRKPSFHADNFMSPKAESPQSITNSENTRQEEDGSWVSSPKDFAFPETIPEEASSVEEERVVIFRLPSAPYLMDSSFFTADASLLQQSQSRRGSRQSMHSRDKDKPSTKFEFDQQELMRGASQKGAKRSASTERDSETSDRSDAFKADVSAATFLDVAVLRCLFISHWQEEGIFWSLQYLYNRLSEIGEESAIPLQQPRKRSNSLPIPQIEISLYQGPGSNSRDSPSGSSMAKDYIEIPDQSATTCIVEESSPTSERRGSEKKKRVKMADLRAFVETKMFSKSEKNLEKVGIDSNTNGKSQLQYADCHRSLDTGEKKLSRSVSMISREPASNLIKGKSMPSLRFYRYVEPPKPIRPSQSTGPRSTFYPRNPIITVTEHTPTPSPDYLKRQGSIDSQLDALSNGGSLSGIVGNGNGSIGFRGHMLRSHTDSHIDYTGVDESEAPGSSFYITRDGGIDYEIILLAVYNVFKRDINAVSQRVLEAGLNICELLLELGVMKLGEHAHEISMGIIRKALLHLGCPHGCNDGVRGPLADFLRSQCQKILARMLRQANSRTKRYLQQMVKTTQLNELIDFFHAFVAFCVDPSSLLSPLSELQSVPYLLLILLF